MLAESPAGRPGGAEAVLDALNPSRVYQRPGEGVVPWAEALPFPLASILWHYEAEPDEAAKVDYLLKFFEGLAQFTATVLLSACITDRTVLDASRSVWFSADICAARPSEIGSNWPNGWQRRCVRNWMPLTEKNAAATCSGPGTLSLPRR